MYSSAFELLDYVVIAVYLLGITAMGIWIGFRRHASSEQYFLASKSLGWFTVGAAVFASNISTIHLVGLAADGARSGWWWATSSGWPATRSFCWRWSSPPIISARRSPPCPSSSKSASGRRPDDPGNHRHPGCAVDPHRHQHVHRGQALRELPGHSDDRLDPGDFAADRHLYGVGRIEGRRGDRDDPALPAAGQRGAWSRAWSIAHLPAMGIHDIAAFKARCSRDQLNMVQTIVGPDGNLREFSWLGIVLGFPILGIWYWCTDQTHVQRVLGARSEKRARTGPSSPAFSSSCRSFSWSFRARSATSCSAKGS